jgi:hypothetical protein
MSSLDHEDAFLQYLRSEEAEATGASLGICLRETHRVHPKVRQETELIDRYVVRLNVTIREWVSHSRLPIKSCLIYPKTNFMIFVSLRPLSVEKG